jgi:hypothetical protein
VKRATARGTNRGHLDSRQDVKSHAAAQYPATVPKLFRETPTMLKSLILILFSLLLSVSAWADNDSSADRTLSAEEQKFLDVVGGLSKEKVLEQLGQPARTEDLTGPNGETVASIWQYDYLNTDEKGEYYKSTELDFVDDRVVTVVFMNTENNSMQPKGQ